MAARQRDWHGTVAVLAVAGSVAVVSLAVWWKWRRVVQARSQQRAKELCAQLGKWTGGRVCVRNAAEVERKWRAIVDGGAANLQVIADFDRTLTSAFLPQSRDLCLSCHGVLEMSPCVTPRFRELGHQRFNHYHPIEVSPQLSREEKIPLMIEWYESNHASLLAESLGADFVEQSVRHAKVELRRGCRRLIESLQRLQVPLLVFSAGVGNVIAEIFKQRGVVVSETTHIISNWMHFNADGKAEFLPPLIHMFNKDESHVVGTPFAQSVIERGNVILLGDSLGDVTMAQGVAHSVVLKIGFLCFKESELLAEYCKAFDIVVLDDGSLDIVNDWIVDNLS